MTALPLQQEVLKCHFSIHEQGERALYGTMRPYHSPNGNLLGLHLARQRVQAHNHAQLNMTEPYETLEGCWTSRDVLLFDSACACAGHYGWQWRG